MRRAESWTIADILDFEYLLAADARGDDAAVRTRDRTIYEQKIAPQIDASASSDRRGIFRRWLEARRASGGEALPGEAFLTGWQTLLTGACLGGLVLGVSLTAGMLHYRGDEPVNVAWFFAATVGVQWLLLLFALAWWLFRKTTGLLDDFRPLRALMSGLLWALGMGMRRLPGEQRERFRAMVATISHHREIYGSLAAWPLLAVTQFFGVCFNVGVLGTLLLHVALSDVAFGWQSTLRTSPEEAFRLVSAIATPWSMLPDAQPTFDQVVASRFAYSEGIKPLSQSAMASWWPFLSYAVFTYGLLVRLALLIWSLVSLRSALRAISFDHHGCNALWRRLSGPVFQAQTGTPDLVVPTHAEAAPQRATGQTLVLLAEGLTIDPAALSGVLESQYGWRLDKTLSAQVDHPSGNVTALAEVGAAAPSSAGIIVAIPARRAPIKAIALFLRKVVAAAGPTEVVVLLFGQRNSDGGWNPVSDQEFTHWRNFNAIHGLHLSLEKWRPG